MTTSAVTLSLIRDTTNDYIFPSKGTKTSVSVTQAGGILQGDTSYTQYSASEFMYFPFPLDIVLGLKGRIGYIQGHDGKKSPFSKGTSWVALILCAVFVTSARLMQERVMLLVEMPC